MGSIRAYPGMMPGSKFNYDAYKADQSNGYDWDYHGFHAPRSEKPSNSKKLKVVRKTLYGFDEKPYKVRRTQGYADYIRFHPSENQQLADERIAYAEAAFDTSKVETGAIETWEAEGENPGHIIGLKYAVRDRVLRVTFEDGTVCLYFKVDVGVAGTLFHMARSGRTKTVTRGNRTVVIHDLGVEFWKLMRVRGSRYGSAYPIEYESHGTRLSVTTSKGQYPVKLNRTLLSILKAGANKEQRVQFDQYMDLLNIVGEQEVMMPCSEEEIIKLGKLLDALYNKGDISDIIHEGADIYDKDGNIVGREAKSHYKTPEEELTEKAKAASDKGYNGSDDINEALSIIDRHKKELQGLINEIYNSEAFKESANTERAMELANFSERMEYLNSDKSKWLDKARSKDKNFRKTREVFTEAAYNAVDRELNKLGLAGAEASEEFDPKVFSAMDKRIGHYGEMADRLKKPTSVDNLRELITTASGTYAWQDFKQKFGGGAISVDINQVAKPFKPAHLIKMYEALATDSGQNPNTINAIGDCLAAKDYQGAFSLLRSCSIQRYYEKGTVETTEINPRTGRKFKTTKPNIVPFDERTKLIGPRDYLDLD